MKEWWERQDAALNLCRVGDLYASSGRSDVCFSTRHSLPFGFISLPLVHPAGTSSHCVNWGIGVLAGQNVTLNIHQANPSSVSLWTNWSRLHTLPLSGLPNWLGQISQWQTGWRWQTKTGCRFMLPKHSPASLSSHMARETIIQIFNIIILGPFSVDFACSFCVYTSSLRVLWLPPTDQHACMWGLLISLNCALNYSFYCAPPAFVLWHLGECLQQTPTTLSARGSGDGWMRLVFALWLFKLIYTWQTTF